MPYRVVCRSVAVVATAALWAACGTGDGTTGSGADDVAVDAGSGAGDAAAADGSGAAPTDGGADVASDAAGDSGPDPDPADAATDPDTTAPDADAAGDAASDVAVDVAVDVAEPDAAPDSGSGPGPDASDLDVADAVDASDTDAAADVSDTDTAADLDADPDASMLPCTASSMCPTEEWCDPCGTASCPLCDDCVAACVRLPCANLAPLTCRMLRPECGPGRVPIVGREGCWVCVDQNTCEATTATEPECVVDGGYCVGAGAFCRLDHDVASTAMGCGDGEQCCVPVAPVIDPLTCNDGSEATCDRIPPVCDASERLAVQDGCEICVNPATCRPWGVPGCNSDDDCGRGGFCDPCLSSSCPGCEDCVAACAAD